MPTPAMTLEKSRGRTLVAYPGEPSRFTLDGSDELENHLAQICEKVLGGVKKAIPAAKLKGLLLGGDYGRGEGGVWRSEAGDRPYQELEFYVFIQGQDWLNERRFGPELRQLARNLYLATGVKMEFKILSPLTLRRSPTSLRYYVLVGGHRWITGDRDLLAGCEHHRAAYAIPLNDATRLLLNACSGLLFAREKLKREPFTNEDADFVAHKLARAQMAFGDVILASFSQYHWSCRERYNRLQHFPAIESWPWFDEVCRHHLAGMQFKLHPGPVLASRGTLERQLEAVSALALEIWLWLESRRLDCRFASARDYVLHPSRKCPNTNPWRNRLLNARVFGANSLFQKHSQRHPYERVLNALAIALWIFPAVDSILSRQLYNDLSLHPGHGASLVQSYQLLWQRFG